MNIPIQVVDGGTIPTKAHPTDAAWDCYARTVDVLPQNIVKCALGFKLELPEGWFADLRPRSSIYKTGLWLSNSCGVVDAGYRGEVMAFFYFGKEIRPIEIPKSPDVCVRPGDMIYLHENTRSIIPKIGDRVIQMMIRKLDEVELVHVAVVDFNTDRGEGGFGSTGGMVVRS